MAGRNEVFVLWDLPEPDVARLQRVRRALEDRLPRVTQPPPEQHVSDDVGPEARVKSLGD